MERETGIEPETFSLGSCIRRIESITYLNKNVLKVGENRHCNSLCGVIVGFIVK